MVYVYLCMVYIKYLYDVHIIVHCCFYVHGVVYLYTRCVFCLYMVCMFLYMVYYFIVVMWHFYFIFASWRVHVTKNREPYVFCRGVCLAPNRGGDIPNRDNLVQVICTRCGVVWGGES